MWPAPKSAQCTISDAFVGVDEVGSSGVEIFAGLVAGENLRGEWAESLLAGARGERLLLRPVGQIQIFEPLDALGLFDFAAQFVGELVLRFDRAEDRLLAVFELPQAC